MLLDLFEKLHFTYIFLAAFLFLAGIYFAPNIVEKNVKWLLVYPRWVARLMEKYFKASWQFLPIFLIILFLNNLSLFTGFLSGFFIIIPFIIAFLTGFHVAVIGYDLMGWQGIWHLLVNPIAWLEFPAAWISFGMGFRLAHTIVMESFAEGGKIFQTLFPLYIKYVLVLLIIAAIVESFFIRWAEKQKYDKNKEN
jgi:hypothetical protein